jgi:hypothetical protein
MFRRAAIIAALAASLFAGARAGKADLVFDVRKSDLSGASLESGLVVLQLAPCKAVEFHQLTQSNVGEALSVRFEGVPVLRAHIRAAIQGGRIVFNSTDERVLSHLAGVAPPQREADSGPVNCAAGPASAK